MVLYGGASGQVPLFDLQILNAKGSLVITRPKLGDFILTTQELQWRAKEIFDSSAISLKANDFFFVRHEGAWIKIMFSDIIYIQALADYATIHTTNGKFTIHTTMKTLEEKEAFLEESVNKNYVLFFEHDPYCICCTVQKTEKGFRIKGIIGPSEVGII